MKTKRELGMRMGLSALIAVSVMLLFATAAVSAETVVSIENVSALPDEVVTVDITAHDVTNLTLFGIKLEYNPSVVNATSAENNPNLPDMMMGESLHDFSHASEGWVGLACNPTTATPVSGAEVVLTTVTLKAVGEAEDVSPLAITIASLKNAADEDISYIAQDGEFTILTLPPSPVKIENASALPGEETTTRIIASDVTNLTQFGIKLEYNPSVVNATSAENNPNLPDTLMGESLHDFSHASEGYVLLGCNPVDATPVSGDEVVLTTVTLKAVGDAEDVSPLDITIKSLKNAAYEDISATPVNGIFTILTPTVTPTPTPTPTPVYHRGGGGAPRDSDGDGYSDVDEMLAGTDKDDPADYPGAPLVTPTPTPTPTVTPTPTATPTIPTVTPTLTPTPTPIEEKPPVKWGWIIGIIIAAIIVGAAAYYFYTKKKA